MRKTSFTLIELLVVVAILGILISMLLPALAKSRMKVRQVHCLSNMKQVLASAYMYATDNQGYLTVARTWQFELEPYSRNKYLTKSDWENSSYKGTIFECLENKVFSSSAPWAGGMGMNWQYMGYFEGAVGSPRQMISKIDTPAETIFSGDTEYHMHWNFKFLYAPLHVNANTPSLDARYKKHGKGANYAWVDGHASFVHKPNILQGKNSLANWYFLRDK
ncbi:MAG: prepilin-type N-terminal cleavage/methylation domain-containing protein [Lentisphaeraceae bacterium]|nr:prepilin-type N-terminal cleavage/methylation domain-containing protein [Lentisphaeraceae bacterium]